MFHQVLTASSIQLINKSNLIEISYHLGNFSRLIFSSTVFKIKGQTQVIKIGIVLLIYWISFILALIMPKSLANVGNFQSLSWIWIYLEMYILELWLIQLYANYIVLYYFQLLSFSTNALI